jgi:two-component system chemotaxis sensor kinase CheA
VSLLELVRLEGDQARTGIEYIHGSPVYRLRGNLLPLVSLNEQLGRGDGAFAAPTGDDATVSIVVLQADDQQFGLVVDDINDGVEIVVKPLGRHLKGIACFAGATIMGDGRIALILDALGIAQTSNVVSELREQSLSRTEDLDDRDAAEQTAFLVVGIGSDDDAVSARRVAVPLDDVARLEEFSSAAVERAGGQDVIQYRDEILTLVSVGEVIGERSKRERVDEASQLQVVVHTQDGHSIGLVVDNILDIIEEAITASRAASAQGISGAAVLQGRVTELLDVEAAIRSTEAGFFDESVGIDRDMVGAPA